MDRIIALYDSYELARQIATELVTDGFATDRVDVTASQDLGRASAMPPGMPEGKIAAYFRTLLTDLDDEAIVSRLVTAVNEGAAAVTVHPRGDIEIARARELLQGHQPMHLFARLAPAESRQGIFGEYAAGKR